MSINEVRWLSECGSTNAYAKEHFEEFGPVGAVYTTNQTAGRGRLGRSWVNAEGRALYYTAVIREPLAQPATLPLLASLAVRDQLAQRYGVDCRIKWPNDLLLNGKKIVGILCESVSYGCQMQGRRGEGLHRRSLRPRHLRGRINFPEFQRLCGPSGPGGALLFSLRSLWKTRVFPRFSTHGFCRAAFVENSCAKNSRGERRFCPKRETPQKINFRPRLPF